MKRHALITVLALSLLAMFCGVCNAQSPHADVVAQVKNELLARGENLSGTCGAFKITSEVGTRLAAEGWGYVHSDGNGCPRPGENYRADTLMQPNGYTIDILRLSESNNGDVSNPLAYNIPDWSQTGNQNPANWRSPFALAPPVPQPFPTPTPVPAPWPAPLPVPTLDLTGVYDRLNSLAQQAERIYADMVARDQARAAQAAALSEQLRKHDEDPSWVRKFFTNSNTITALLAGVGAILAQQAAQ